MDSLLPQSKHNLTILLVFFLIAFVGLVVFFHSKTKSYATGEAKKQALNALLLHRAIHGYVTGTQRPEIFRLQEEGKLYPDYFSPKVMSCTYIARSIQEQLNIQRLDYGLEPIYFKLASKNPRNPINRADTLEAALLDKMKHGDSREYQEVVELAGQQYLYLAVPIGEADQSCMKCHGRPEDAPRDLLDAYGDKAGFHESASDIRAFIFIRIPLAEVFASADRITRALTLVTLLVLSFIYGLIVFFTRKLNARQLRKLAESQHERERISKYSHDLEQLLKISQEMTSTTDLKKLYRFAVVAARELLGLDFSTLMLVGNDKNGLTIVDTIGFPDSFIGQFTLLRGQGLSTHVVQHKKPETVLDFTREDRFEVPGAVHEHNIHSAICVPMMLEETVFGVLIGHTVGQREFSRLEISLYQNIGNHAATAIKNALNLEALKKEEKKLHDVTSHLAEGLYVMDRTGQVTFVNEEAVRLLGWSQAEMDGKNIHELVHYRRADGSPLPLEDCAIHNVVYTGTSHVSSNEVFVSRDGTVFPVSVVSSPILDNGQVVASVTSFRNISEIKRIEQEREKLIVELREAETALRRLSETDVLTGLANRRAFNEQLEEEWRRALRMDQQLAMLMLDIDFFKNYNDSYGHLLGDECLKSVAVVLKNAARRPGDIVARFGGEEFVILLSMSDTEHAVTVAEKIRLDVEALGLSHEKSKISDHVTISIGVASAMPANRDISSQELIQHADDALYQAKHAGRNRVTVYPSDP